MIGARARPGSSGPSPTSGPAPAARPSRQGRHRDAPGGMARVSRRRRTWLGFAVAIGLAAPMWRPSDAEAAGTAVAPNATSADAASGPARPASTAAPAALALPTYPTAAPPSFRHVYGLRKGFLSGRGSMVLERQGATRYEARLEGSVLGFRVLDLVSSGHIDAAGFAPDRYVDARRGRAAQVAEFRRAADGDAAGRITYSGSFQARPLPAGAQDRLSWMLQLAAVTAARPLAAGARIEMFVSGAKGDANVWSFRVVDQPSLRLAGSVVPTLHLIREARRENDSHAEIWLDPARHHLPVRAVWGPDRPGEEPLELQLEESDPP